MREATFIGGFFIYATFENDQKADDLIVTIQQNTISYTTFLL